MTLAVGQLRPAAGRGPARWGRCAASPSTVWHLRQPCARGDAAGPAAAMLLAGACRARRASAVSCRATQAALLRPRATRRTPRAPAPPPRPTSSSARRRSTRRRAPGSGPACVAVNQVCGVAAGQRVLLDAERGHEEGVDDVPRGEQQPHRAVRGHAQHAHRVGPLGIGELPHPLLAHHVDVHRVRRRASWPRRSRGSRCANQSRKNAQRHADRTAPRATPGRLDVRGGLVLGRRRR